MRTLSSFRRRPDLHLGLVERARQCPIVLILILVPLHSSQGAFEQQINEINDDYEHRYSRKKPDRMPEYHYYYYSKNQQEQILH